MNIEPQQRNVLIVGTVVGALLGVGAAWLMIQSAGDESNAWRKTSPTGRCVQADLQSGWSAARGGRYSSSGVITGKSKRLSSYPFLV